MEFKSIRRVVVGHDAQGKAVAVFDGDVAPKQRSPGGNAVANLWITGEFPVDPNGAADRAQTQVGVPPPAGGTIFRIVDFPPASTAAPPSHVDHEKILTGMGIDPATQGYARHRNTHPDLGRLAAIGYCFGGMAVLEMARDGQNDLAGIVSFHGVLAAPMPLKPNTYKGKILALHGVDDPVVPDDMTMGFWQEMRDAKADWEFVAYGKALHTFTNWLMPEDGPPPAVYNKQADQRSWIAMNDFFDEIFA